MANELLAPESKMVDSSGGDLGGLVLVLYDVDILKILMLLVGFIVGSLECPDHHKPTRRFPRVVPPLVSAREASV